MKLPILIITKCISWILRLFHRGGSFPGQIALKLKRYTHMFSLRLPRDFNQRNEWKNIHKQYDCGYFFKVEKTSRQ